MKSFNLFSSLLLCSLSTASPVPSSTTTVSRSTSCPPIFALYVSTTNHTYTNLTITQSGGSTYLALKEPTGSDSVARFYRKPEDETHLFATGFNISYMQSRRYPPYQLATFKESGFNSFLAPGSINENTYTTGNYSVYSTLTTNPESKNNSIVVFTDVDGGTGGWWVCGKDDASVGVWQVLMGTSGFDAEDTCERVSMYEKPLEPIAADVC